MIDPGVVRCETVVEEVCIQAEEDRLLQLPVGGAHRIKGGLVHIPDDPACKHALQEVGVGGELAGNRPVPGEPALEGFPGGGQFKPKAGPFGARDKEVPLVERVRDPDLAEAVEEDLQLGLPDDHVVHESAPASSMMSRISWIWCGIIIYGFATSSVLFMAR